MSIEQPINQGKALPLIEEQLNAIRNQTCSFNNRTFDFLQRVGGNDLSCGNKEACAPDAATVSPDNALSRIADVIHDIQKQFDRIEENLGNMDKIA